MFVDLLSFNSTDSKNLEVRFARHPYYWDNHFFKTDTTMLESVAIVINKMIVIIGIT